MSFQKIKDDYGEYSETEILDEWPELCKLRRNLPWGHEQPLSLDRDEKEIVIVSLNGISEIVRLRPFKRTELPFGIENGDTNSRIRISLVPYDEMKTFAAIIDNCLLEAVHDYFQKMKRKSVEDYIRLYDSYYDENEQKNACTTYTYHGPKNPDRDPIAEKENRRARKQKQRLERKSTTSRAPVKYAERKCVGRQNYNFKK